MSKTVERPLLAWIDGVLVGEVRAISRAITSIENHDTNSQTLLQGLFPHTGKATIVGITGPSGAGKSTLVASLAKAIRQSGKTVGILAIDPTSPFSGGAILGDRIRMQAHSGDAGTFIRSMATRGALGGLSNATFEAAMVLDAAGKDYVLIETVGVGQDEVNIAKLADATIVVLVPGLGDDIQAFKAGIMEIADIFVINKADLPGAERVEQDVIAALSLASGPEANLPLPEIVKTVATCDEGVPQLLQTITTYIADSKQSGNSNARRKAIWRERLTEMLRDRIQAQVSQSALTAERLDQYATSIANRTVDPYTLVDELLKHVHESTSGESYNADSVKQGIALDHLGIGVKTLIEAVKFYESALGLKVSGYETIESQKTRVAMLPVGDSRIELLEPTEPNSPIGKFVEKRGEGLHHICLRVPNLRASIEHLKSSGVMLINDQPQIGAGGHEFVFIHPRSASGVLIELVQAHGVNDSHNRTFGEI